jgi:hypothetical protein
MPGIERINNDLISPSTQLWMELKGFYKEPAIQKWSEFIQPD